MTIKTNSGTGYVRRKEDPEGPAGSKEYCLDSAKKDKL